MRGGLLKLADFQQRFSFLVYVLLVRPKPRLFHLTARFQGGGIANPDKNRYKKGRRPGDPGGPSHNKDKW